MIVKVCGMTDGRNVRQVEDAGAEWMGFIFYPLSPRFVSRMPDYLPERAKRVGVFVNASAEDIASAVRRWKLDLVQLHGKESPAQCLDVRTLGVEVVKAFAIKSREDLAKVSGFPSPPYFFRVFRQYTGISPKEYQRQENAKVRKNKTPDT